MLRGLQIKPIQFFILIFVCIMRGSCFYIFILQAEKNRASLNIIGFLYLLNVEVKKRVLILFWIFLKTFVSFFVTEGSLFILQFHVSVIQANLWKNKFLPLIMKFWNRKLDLLTPQDFLANLASIVNCYLHHQGAAASQEEDKWNKKDIKTPDDDHSNEHQSQSQVSSGMLSAFLDSFNAPMVGQAPNVTIADFYKMVEALTDVMQARTNQF